MNPNDADVMAMQVSKSLFIQVVMPEAGDMRLPTPFIAEANGGELNLAAFAGNARATVERWPLVAAGQRVWLQVDGRDSGGRDRTVALLTGHAITVAEAQSRLDETVLRNDLQDFADGTTITVRCWVTFDQSSDRDRAVAFPPRTYTIRLAEPFYIDPSEVQLQVGGTARRQAKGGIPPYTYKSGTPLIATVDASGLVKASRAGMSQILASDAGGSRGSYNVRVESAFYIDPSMVTLDVGQTFNRSASGGTPPYTYTSSVPSRVQVTSTSSGAIRALAQGDATITASDSAGHRGSYTALVKTTIPQPVTEDFELAPVIGLGHSQSLSLGSGTYTAEVIGNAWVQVVTTAAPPPYFMGRSIQGHNAAIWIRPRTPCTRMRIGFWSSGLNDIYCYATDGDPNEQPFMRIRSGSTASTWLDLDARPYGRTIRRLQLGMRDGKAEWAIDNITYFFD